jgi:hypothetical protein
LEQLKAVWIGGSPLVFQAAALNRTDQLGPDRNWEMLIAWPAKAIGDEEFSVRVTTRNGITYSSRAKVKFANLHPPAGVAPSVVLVGTRPLSVWHQA